jgi:hypothetical protein
MPKHHGQKLGLQQGKDFVNKPGVVEVTQGLIFFVLGRKDL